MGQGKIGETGPLGPRDIVNKGDKGDTGGIGLVGQKGDTGVIGLVGQKGDTGLTGQKGDTGLTGQKGDVGLIGQKGDTGIFNSNYTGNLKIQGSIDALNYTINGKPFVGGSGQKGDQGLIGAIGQKGDQGAIGQKGDQGAIGQKGDQGVIGQKGDQGLVGAIGQKGDQGLVGGFGAKGDKGDKGDQGLVGGFGAKGDKGDQGLVGEFGTKGDKGDQGAIGQKGDQGLVGGFGVKGDKGDKGDKGEIGVMGPIGGPGPLGVMAPLADAPMYFRGVGDKNHGIGYSNNKGIDGPSLWGNLGGGLGTASNRDSITWNNKGDMNIGGEGIINNNKNPIKFSSKWSNFPDGANNRAEISNDTDSFKTLMLVGNKSGGNGRQVSIWDDLRVDRKLYIDTICNKANTECINFDQILKTTRPYAVKSLQGPYISAYSTPINDPSNSGNSRPVIDNNWGKFTFLQQ